MEISRRQNIIAMWLFWQFAQVPVFLFGVWGNYLRFTENYFSVVTLLKTLISPWRRMNWQYPKTIDIYQFFLALTSNIFSRFLGAMLRVILIVLGIVAYILVLIGGGVILLGWLLIPFVIIAGFFLLFLL